MLKFDLPESIQNGSTWISRIKLAGIIAILPMLGGCATIDRFGGRTVRYNSETADAKSQSILTNIMRAAYGQPLQFSDISTVSGQGNASANIGSSLPLSVTPSSATTTYSVSPGASIGGSATFNVTNLNTQEFYNGMQAPITLNQIANLIDSGYDARTVLFLTVSDIYVSDGTKRLQYHNGAENPTNYNAFWATMGYLVDAGFSTRTSEGAPYGTTLTPANLSDPRVVAATLGAASSELQLKSIKKEGDKADSFQFFKKGGMEVCFNRLRNTNQATVLPKDPDPTNDASQPLSLRDQRQKTEKINIQAANDANVFLPFLLTFGQQSGPDGKTPVDIPFLTFTVDVPHICGYKPPKGAKPAEKSKLEITMKTRSVEGILQFLGTVARAQTGIAGSPRLYSFGDEYNPMPNDPYLFRVTTDPNINPFTSTTLNGVRYFVNLDAAANDRSTRVLQILTDLIALQSSAKNIPSPNLISILGR